MASPVIKFTLQELDPYTFLAYRFGISSVASLIVIGLTRHRLPKDKKVLVELFVWGFINSTVGLGLLFLGLEKTTVIDMTIITMANPLIVAFAGAYFLREHITRREKIGTLIALTGITITTIEPILQNHANGSLTGNLLVTASLIAGTTSSVLVKRLTRKGVSPVFMVNLSFIIGFITFLPLALLEKGLRILTPILEAPLPYHIGVIYMALISGNLAYILWVRGQKTIEISEASLFSYLNPIFAIPLAILWLGEKVYSSLFIGAIFVVVGVSLAELKRARKARS